MKIRGVCKTQQYWSWPTEKNTPFIEQIWVIDISTHQKESHFRVILVTELVTQRVQNSKRSTHSLTNWAIRSFTTQPQLLQNSDII